MEIKAISYDYKLSDYKKSIFLAGSIDNGKAENWQSDLVSELDSEEILLFNPRRDNWNSNLEPIKENEEFRKQVEWELDHIDIADIVIFYFSEESKAPISFLELGICLEKSKDVIIYCPEKFYRKGNIDITAEQYSFNVFSDRGKFINHLRKVLE
tara:strand:+ start:42296 stop:42760 length:465 start_codon:yes stop_codon:yes gene_type:complete